MDTREAYDAILNALREQPQKFVIDSFSDDDVFGNLWITNDEGDERLSIVNERGQLTLNDGEDGVCYRCTLLADLYAAEKQAVVEAVT